MNKVLTRKLVYSRFLIQKNNGNINKEILLNTPPVYVTSTPLDFDWNAYVPVNVSLLLCLRFFMTGIIKKKKSEDFVIYISTKHYKLTELIFYHNDGVETQIILFIYLLIEYFSLSKRTSIHFVFVDRLKNSFDTSFTIVNRLYPFYT